MSKYNAQAITNETLESNKPGILASSVIGLIVGLIVLILGPVLFLCIPVDRTEPVFTMTVSLAWIIGVSLIFFTELFFAMINKHLAKDKRYSGMMVGAFVWLKFLCLCFGATITAIVMGLYYLYPLVAPYFGVIVSVIGGIALFIAVNIGITKYFFRSNK